MLALADILFSLGVLFAPALEEARNPWRLSSPGLLLRLRKLPGAKIEKHWLESSKGRLPVPTRCFLLVIHYDPLSPVINGIDLLLKFRVLWEASLGDSGPCGCTGVLS